MELHFSDEPRALICGDWYTAALVARELESRHWYTASTDNLEETCQMLDEDDFDLLIVEWKLPAFNAFEVIHHVRTELNNSEIKLLVISEGIGIETEMKLKIYGKVGFMHIPFCGLDFDCFKEWHHHQTLPARRPVA